MGLSLDNIEIDPNFEAVIVCSEGHIITNISSLLSKFGINEVKIFKLGFHCIDYLRRKKAGLIILTPEIDDMQWMNFARMVRTDEKTIFAPMVIASQKRLDLEPEEIELLSDYQIVEYIEGPFTIQQFTTNIKKAYLQHTSETSYMSQLNRAKVMYKEGLLNRAQHLYNQILQTTKRDLPARTGLMRSLRNQDEKYLEQLNYLLEADPKNYNFRFELMEHYLSKNDQSRFRFFFNKLSEDLSKNADAYWLEELGEICLSLKINEFCEKIAEIMIDDSVNISSWKPYLLKARSRLATGNLREARSLVEEAAKRTRDNIPEVINIQGIIERRMNRQESALRLFKKASHLAPYDHRILFNIALCHLSLDQYDDSLVCLDKAIEYFPGYSKAKQIRSKVQRMKEGKAC